MLYIFVKHCKHLADVNKVHYSFNMGYRLTLSTHSQWQNTKKVVWFMFKVCSPLATAHRPIPPILFS